MKAGGTFGCLVHFAGTPLRVGPRKFAGPVSLSSTVSTDFRLPATAFGLGFDLLALCARRKRESNGLPKRVKGPKKERGRNLRSFPFSTFPQRFFQLVETSVERNERRPEDQRSDAAVASANRPPTLTHSQYSRAVRRRETVIAVAAAAFVLALVLAALRVG